MTRTRLPDERQRKINVQIAAALAGAIKVQGVEEVTSSEMLMHQSHMDTCPLCHESQCMLALQTEIVLIFVGDMRKIGVFAASEDEKDVILKIANALLSTDDEVGEGLAGILDQLKNAIEKNERED